MARKARGPSPHLKTALLEKGHRHAFSQALRLLRRVVDLEGGDRAFWRRVRVRPHLGLGFAASDVVSVKEDDRGGFVVTVSFLGLYGSSSPLPTWYTEDLMEEEAGHRSVARDFLDVLNGAVYPLHFASWGRHRLFHSLVEARDPAMAERLFCLLGLPRPDLACGSLPPMALLTFLGLFTLGARPAEGLRALLSTWFEEPGLRVVPCAERTVTIPEAQRCRLGAQRLGEDACLGTRIEDRTGKFRVEVGPLPPERARRYLPGGEAFRELADLVRLYARDPLDWDLRLEVAGDAAAGLRLGGDAGARLGRDAWIASPGAAPPRATVTFQP